VVRIGSHLALHSSDLPDEIFRRDGMINTVGVCVAVAKSSVKVEDDDDIPLEQQENLQIKGSKARTIMMQKLLRKSEVKLKRSTILVA